MKKYKYKGNTHGALLSIALQYYCVIESIVSENDEPDTYSLTFVQF